MYSQKRRATARERLAERKRTGTGGYPSSTSATSSSSSSSTLDSSSGSSDTSSAQLLQIGLMQEFKKEGNKNFAKKDYHKALETYHASMEAVQFKMPKLTAIEERERLNNEYTSSIEQDISARLFRNVLFRNYSHIKTDVSKILSNQSECHLRLKEYRNCIFCGRIALLLNPLNEKAVFRVAKAYESLGELQESLKYYQRVLKINPRIEHAIEGVRRVNECLAAMVMPSAVLTMFTELNYIRERLFIFPKKISLIPGHSSHKKDDDDGGASSSDVSSSVSSKELKKKSAEESVDDGAEHPSVEDGDARTAEDSSESVKKSEEPAMTTKPVLIINEDLRKEVMKKLSVMMAVVLDSKNRRYFESAVGEEHPRILIQTLFAIAMNDTKQLRLSIPLIPKSRESGIKKAKKKSVNERCLRKECLKALILCLKQFTDRSMISTANERLVTQSFDEVFDCLLNRHVSYHVLYRLLHEQSKFPESILDSQSGLDSSSMDVIKSLRWDDTLDPAYMSLLVSLLCDLYTNQHFFKVTHLRNKADTLLVSMIQRLRVPFDSDEYQSTSSLDSSSDSSRTAMSEYIRSVIYILCSLIRRLGLIALKNSSSGSGGDWKLLSNIREKYTREIIDSNLLVFNSSLSYSFIKFLVCCSGLKSAYDEISDSRLNILKKAFEKNLRDWIKTPLVRAFKTAQLTHDNSSLCQRLVALSCVLQSNYKLGTDISATEEILNLLVLIASGENDNEQIVRETVAKVCKSGGTLASSSSGLAKIDESKALPAPSSSLDSSTTELRVSDKSIFDMGGPEEKAESERVERKTGYLRKKLKWFASEVLALSCSSQPIRNAMKSSGSASIFVMLLNSPNPTVKANAACTLAKFASVDEDARELALGCDSHSTRKVKSDNVSRVLLCVMDLMDEVLKDSGELDKMKERMKQRQTGSADYYAYFEHTAASISSGSSRMIDSHGGSDVLLLGPEDHGGNADNNNLQDLLLMSKEQRINEYELPLINLCVETVSYLSLHIEVKRSLILDNDGYYMIQLSQLSDTKYFQLSRVIRHGLLTILLNCSVSKKDVLRFMTMKERQIHMLKKATSKGLEDGQNPIKEDELIHSFAGSDEEIAKIQEVMLDLKCIKLMYDIVKCSARESAILEEIVDEELTESTGISKSKGSGSSSSSTKSKRSEKLPTPSAKEVSQRNLRLSEKMKYLPNELESDVQLKISQVLLKFAQAGSPIYDGMKLTDEDDNDDDDEGGAGDQDGGGSDEGTAMKKASKKDESVRTEEEKKAALKLEPGRQMRSYKELVKSRGKLVQQNAIRLCLDMFAANSVGKGKYSEDNEKIRLNCCATIARIGLSINPALINESHIQPMISVLLYLIKNANHQLPEYEALIALCNLSSMNDDVRRYILKQSGWHNLRDSFEEEHPSINAAILECWCNLAVCDEGLQFLTKNGETDLKIICLFLRHESNRVLLAVSALLCMAGQIQENCDRIARFGGVIALHVVLDTKQKELSEYPDHSAVEYQQCAELISRVTMALSAMEEAGYSLRNWKDHNMEADILAEVEESSRLAG